LYMVKKIMLLFLFAAPVFVIAQTAAKISSAVADTVFPNQQIVLANSFVSPQRFYLEKNGDSFFCKKPTTFSFITNIPGNALGYVKQSFQKKNLYKVGIVAGATALLLLFDQQITDGVQSFARRNGISAEDDFSPFFRIKIFGKPTNIGKWPHNFNTAIYNVGQGSSVIWMAAGFFIAGKIKHDNRALQTSSQLVESFLALGAGTQILKYGSGRETPFQATTSGGRWRPFPPIGDFQNDKTKYDAFPSGHLATLVGAITIISENYPKKKWIKPIGYTLASLLSFVMINNGVHYAGDYPLGFALGYGYGKFIARKSHLVHRSAPLL
jgi:hypothetical protein